MKFSMLKACVAAGGLVIAGPAEAADVVLYVDQNHTAASDSNIGTHPDFPLKTFSEGAAKAWDELDSGNPVLLKVGPGKYYSDPYEQFCGSNTVEYVIEGDPNRETIISGSFTNGFESSTWTPVPGKPNVYMHDWTNTYSLRYGPDKFEDSAAIRKELLFFNEQRLNQKAIDLYSYNSTTEEFEFAGNAPAGLDVLDEDWTYCVSDNASADVAYRDKIFMRLPAGEVPVAESLIEIGLDCEFMFKLGQKHNVTMRYMNFEKASIRYDSFMVQFNECDNFLVEDCTFNRCNAHGFICVYRDPHPDWTGVIKRCDFNGNGYKGVKYALERGGNSFAVDCDFNDNCWRAEMADKGGWGAAGIKVANHTFNALLTRCNTLNNQHNGLWEDVECSNVVFDACFSYGNYESGIFMEYSWVGGDGRDCRTENSVSAYNQRGIQVCTSRKPVVDGNLCLNNIESNIRFRKNSRDPHTAEGFISLTMTNNEFVMQHSGVPQVDLEDSGEMMEVLLCSGNDYYSSDTAKAFLIDNSAYKTFSGWKTELINGGAPVPQDSDSGMSTVPDIGTDPYHFDRGSVYSDKARGLGTRVPWKELGGFDRGVFSKDLTLGDTMRGSGYFDSNANEYVVVSAGTDIGGTQDEGAFLFNRTGGGSTSIVVRVDHVENTHADANAGVMIRESNRSGARMVLVGVTAENGARLRYRTVDGGTASEVTMPGISAPYWVKLEMDAAGQIFDGSVSSDGMTWQPVGSTIDMGSPFADDKYMGLAASSHSSNVYGVATFSQLNEQVNPPEPVSMLVDYQHNDAVDTPLTSLANWGTDTTGWNNDVDYIAASGSGDLTVAAPTNGSSVKFNLAAPLTSGTVEAEFRVSSYDLIGLSANLDAVGIELWGATQNAQQAIKMKIEWFANGGYARLRMAGPNADGSGLQYPKFTLPADASTNGITYRFSADLDTGAYEVHYKLDSASDFTLLGTPGVCTNLTQLRLQTTVSTPWTSNTFVNIDYLTLSHAIDLVTPESLYMDWLAEFPTLGSFTNVTDNPDADALDNLGEYAMGGIPTNGTDIGYEPVFQPLEAGGTNWFEFVYAQRTDADIRGLEYSLETNTNLLNAAGWTNAHYEITGTNASYAAGFESITNRISTATETNQFIRLHIKTR
ncbi:right-handed parallel beta-helix repeat-containing protein [Pontiella agarivorans]|uniref:Right-handed parallel beta-helix repeat-containing protein n=1 Tax=Pontiella agarivorans TaxID=3038953 RepID=A0ABU5MYK8_9BACT|nr:right-handed parallel beta-helix repeat-containing protein [Pontiella agarivorans]MDZ8119066.1 right-handed parallel beta-helix repeat-containing protein [Pontiella agarivorans]